VTANSRAAVTVERIEWTREPVPPEPRIGPRDDLSFGNAFTANMASLRWSEKLGWHNGHIGPHRAIPMPPSMVGLHYGQVVFEGLKVFPSPDGSVSAFRLSDHARRFAESAARLAIPPLPQDLFVTAVEELVRADFAEVPDDPSRSLYLRPIIFADDPCLALRPAKSYRFLLLAFVTEEFFQNDDTGLSIWADTTYIRAAPGGAGAAKAAGNYAPGYLAQAEATAHGCQQVLWLDAVQRRYVEEMGGMNVFLVQQSPEGTTLVTPPLTGTILPGITRDSLMTIAKDLGLRSVERPILLEDWKTSAASGLTREAFACGTAAVVTPIRQVVTPQGAWSAGADPHHPVTSMLRQTLTEVQRGHRTDPRGWRHVIAAGTTAAP
jgi:branched-chain amino acid aminotransferase